MIMDMYIVGSFDDNYMGMVLGSVLRRRLYT